MSITVNLHFGNILYVLSVLFSGYYLFKIFADGPYWYPHRPPRKLFLKTRTEAILTFLLVFIPVCNVLGLWITAASNGYLDNFYAWFEKPVYKVGADEDV